MVNKQSQYSVGIKNVNENTMEDLEVSIKGTMELVNNYLKETEDKIQKLSDELKKEKNNTKRNCERIDDRNQSKF